MKDTIIKGSGNSRLIKTVPNAPTLWPTHEALMQEWATNGLPIDLLGLVAAGVQQAGTDLNKANMLPDAVEQAIWGSAANRNVGQALQQLRSLITAVQSTADGKLDIESGSYVGSGIYGYGNENSLTFSKNPKLVLIWAYNGGNVYFGLLAPNSPGIQLRAIVGNYYDSLSGTGLYVVIAGNSVTWYGGVNAESQLNYKDFTYHYYAIV